MEDIAQLLPNGNPQVVAYAVSIGLASKLMAKFFANIGFSKPIPQLASLITSLVLFTAVIQPKSPQEIATSLILGIIVGIGENGIYMLTSKKGEQT